ncbi:MAG TPA: cytochrome c biogenesis protein [Candidatus Polarisedimenticolaceae bacterium]|nr:cytochrome c biogenesis protein [Candidatus Polarisedimenticolaceae bacterium]
MNRAVDRTILVLWLAALLAVPLSLWTAFRYAPEEKVMGAVQRIFYYHVPSAIMTYVAVLVLLAASIAYLWTRRTGWDLLARSASETALLFCSVVLITGPIWAKPAWGVWWTWEARLTTTLLLWVLLAGCLLVRHYAETRELGARLGAILSIVAALDVPIIHKAVTWWRGQHPEVFKPGAAAPLAPEMHAAFLTCLGTFLVLTGLLLLLRYRVLELEDRGELARERLMAR